MNALQQWQRCPDCIHIDDQKRSARLLKRDDLFAIRGAPRRERGDTVEVQLPGDDISIVRGAPPADAYPDAEFLPVYAAPGNATPAVVTGRVFLCLRDALDLEPVRADIEALGFEIVDTPAYAPHSAWLAPRSGRVVDALSKLDALRALPGAERVEPQILRPKGWKSRP